MDDISPSHFHNFLFLTWLLHQMDNSCMEARFLQLCTNHEWDILRGIQSGWDPFLSYGLGFFEVEMKRKLVHDFRDWKLVDIEIFLDFFSTFGAENFQHFPPKVEEIQRKSWFSPLFRLKLGKIMYILIFLDLSLKIEDSRDSPRCQFPIEVVFHPRLWLKAGIWELLKCRSRFFLRSRSAINNNLAHGCYELIWPPYGWDKSISFHNFMF